MAEKPDVTEAITHNGFIYPSETPNSIQRAIAIASSSQYCEFTSFLSGPNKWGEYSIEALIGPEEVSLGESSSPKYRVKFLIPKSFPYKVVHTIPLNPNLKWYQHQNGDWPIDIDYHANVICPPPISSLQINELLQPYIRHSYKWIYDALKGELIKPTERYEFPHLVAHNEMIKFYSEGEEALLPKLNETKVGIAKVAQIENSIFKDGLYRTIELHDLNGNHSLFWESTVRSGLFGDENETRWVPWIYFGNPVVESPHRPPVRWSDIPILTKRNIFNAIRVCIETGDYFPILLISFGIPELWHSQQKLINWQAIDIHDIPSSALFPPKRGYSPYANPLSWPGVIRFFNNNKPLQWISVTDISSNALSARGGEANSIRNLNIAILGLGALGSHLASSISKLNPSSILLVDNDKIEPGNLIRHEALPVDVECPKADSMKKRLIFSGIKVNSLHEDILKGSDKLLEYLEQVDLIVDATGNHGVHEWLLRKPKIARKMIAWCYIKPGPKYGFLALKTLESDYSLQDAETAIRDSIGEEEWHKFQGVDYEPNMMIWPEPGCYHPTFNAPNYRVRMMVDAFIATLISWLQAGANDNIATLFSQTNQGDYLGIEQHIAKQVSS